MIHPDHIPLSQSAALQLHFVPTVGVQVITEEDPDTMSYSNISVR